MRPDGKDEAGENAAANAPIAGSLPSEQALALAGQHLQSGRLAEAETTCRRILQTRPDYAPALHLLGIILYRAGNLRGAMDLVRQAITADATVALYHCNLGEMARLSGQRDLALAAGRRALDIDPKLAHALNNVGIVHFERGEFDEAIAHYRRAIAEAPDFAEAHSNLGNALRAKRKYAEALRAYQDALRLRPTFGDALNNLGTTLRDMGRRDEAETVYRRALSLNPSDPSVLNNLALALKENERLDEANALLTRSLLVDPNSPKTLTYLALVKLEQKQFADAEIAAQRALALAGEEPDALNAMGLVRFEQQNSEAALALFRRAVELKPDLADAHNNIGNILKENGQLAAAREAYERAVELEPHQEAYYVNLADSKRFAPGDVHLAAMERLLGASSSSTARSRLNFALAKAYDDLGRVDEAFARMREGNALKRERVAYDEPAMLRLFDGIGRIFDRKLLEAKAGSGHGSSLPVFIVGMPRSGTTLVEQILASHPMVHGAGELIDFNHLVDQMCDASGRFFRYPEDAPALTASQLHRLGKNYAEGLRRRAPSAGRVTNKMPANFLFLGLIHLALPGARIIHVQRDPRDTCLSCYSKLFTAEQNFTYDLGELARYYLKYAELMAHWREVLPDGAMLEIRYEDVIADLEGSARRMIDYCGLAWDPRCILFHEARRPVRTASASQVRRPVYRSSEGRWRAYEHHLGPALSVLDRLTGR